MISILIIVLVVCLLVGAFPSWNHSGGWGYGPSGLIGVILIVLLIWMITGGHLGRW